MKPNLKRGEIVLVTESQPGIEGRTLIALIENICALLASRQCHITVDPTQRIPYCPAPEREEAPHLVAAVSGADQCAKPHSGSGHVPPFRPRRPQG